jgi:glycosyltransferase involved in cell wall biosynthesis
VNNPIISIVVPVYNVEQFLERCIKSLLNQTIVNKEIIFINDGSTDSSYSILEKYKMKYPEIVIINKKNGGLSSARNAGIEIARGDFIGFVDSDDYIEETMYEKMINCATNKKVDIVICKNKLVYENGNIKNSKGFLEEKVLDGYNGFKALLNKKDFANHACDKIYKRELFINNNIRYPEGRYYEDAFTTYKLIYNAKKIAYLDQHLYYYFQRTGSITQSGFSDKELDYIQALKEIKDFIFENNITGVEKEYYTMCIKISLRLLSKLNYDMYKNKVSSMEFEKYRNYLLVFLKKTLETGSVDHNNLLKQRVALFLIKINYNLFYIMDNLIKVIKTYAN